jgi:hypothetical protein
MNIQKKLVYIGMFFAFLVLIYMLFSSGEKPKANREAADSLVGILGGGSLGGGSGSGSSRTARDPQGRSVFDSEFYNSGNFSYEEMETGKANAPDGDIPINPQTGKPYPESAMEQFDRLRDMFPDNELIPKRLTPEVKAKQEKQAQRLAEATRAVFGGVPKREDLDFYYGSLEKQVDDRLEIIEYLIEVQGGEDDEMDKKFQEVLSSIKSQKEQIRQEKEDAYKRAPN